MKTSSLPPGHVRDYAPEVKSLIKARAAAYSKHFAACQAGGMSSDASHEYASELAARGADCSVPLADRMKGGRSK